MKKKEFETLVNQGDILGAQQLMLKELETEFGGSAIAARQTFGGALQALNNLIGDVQEKMGALITGAILPMVNEFTNLATEVNLFLESEDGLRKVGEILKPISGIASIAGTAFKLIFDLFSFMDGIRKMLSKPLPPPLLCLPIAALLLYIMVSRTHHKN